MAKHYWKYYFLSLGDTPLDARGLPRDKLVGWRSTFIEKEGWKADYGDIVQAVEDFAVVVAECLCAERGCRGKEGDISLVVVIAPDGSHWGVSLDRVCKPQFFASKAAKISCSSEPIAKKSSKRQSLVKIKCKHCKKSRGVHGAKAMQCPAGLKTGIGYTRFHLTDTFEPIPSREEDYVRELVWNGKVDEARLFLAKSDNPKLDHLREMLSRGDIIDDEERPGVFL